MSLHGFNDDAARRPRDGRLSSTPPVVGGRSWPVLFRYVWALPTTLVGLVGVAAIGATGGSVGVCDGVVEACGGCASRLSRRSGLVPGGIAAMALGHVVLAVDARLLARTRAHERVHVRQAERWGPAFIPAYALSSLWLFCRGRDPYFDNPFEREAYALEPLASDEVGAGTDLPAAPQA
jgi:hypothetical protein